MDDSQAAIETLVRVHGSRVWGLLLGLLGDRGEAEDAYQETWFDVWRSLGRLRARTRPWAYIRRTAVSRAVDRLRRRGRSRETPGLPPGLEHRAPPPGWMDLTCLRPEVRAALVLYFWGGLSVREVAGLMEVPPGTVKSWMHRGRRRLRSRLTREGGPR